MTRPLVVSPFLHRHPDRFESPLGGGVLDPASGSGALLRAAEPGAPFLHAPQLTSEELDRLIRERFLIEDPLAESRRARLLYASVETCSICNHRCSFCPVSVDPRSMEVMPQPLFERIVDEILAAADPEMGFFLNNYNEPTVDPMFLERLELLFRKNVRIALLTNASRLTPAKVERIRAMGKLRYLGINLPTVDEARYTELHGTTDLPQILENVEHLVSNPPAEENVFVVLGYGDERHDHDLRLVEERFGGRGFHVRRFRLQNRAGLVDGMPAVPPKKRLAGCELVGSRPLQHLQVQTSGKVVFCCQDYYETEIVGDLTKQSVREVLESERFAQLRRWSYGVDEAPDAFMCRRCEYALERPEPSAEPLEALRDAAGAERS